MVCVWGCCYCVLLLCCWVCCKGGTFKLVVGSLVWFWVLVISGSSLEALCDDCVYWFDVFCFVGLYAFV